MKKEKPANTLAKRAQSMGLGDVSIYVWEACCMRWGSGGTPEANGAYEKIMKVILEELKPTHYDNN